ncbi:cytidine deaminase [Terracoccus luteus]|uniref:Cytidine deaminase n=1 Tax=Terracoccus luteus TaxID=53356 RepID=A0A495XUQ2_9MICO|nr:cytidine deaminase [Terracoccus luteus]MBB2985517.1 cytidine deaminase [Terracoccus luteus]MCP2171169.1 cytidine deaminase [Terracoccus luteus]RKT78270.1 cytidine deaminase [Terracoccus luteus]
MTSHPPGPDAGGPGAATAPGAASVAVDWEALHERAVELMRRAYAPYSRFPVGVAGLVDDGRVVAGCNVENAAYGVALCAECGMVSELHATGGGRLVAVYCVGGDGQPLMACGRCRQLLWENGGPECLVMTPEGVLPMTAVLPQAFGAHDLDAAR